MKRVTLAVIVFSTLFAFQSHASVAGACVPYSGGTILRDPGDAFPWGSELPFPWRGIQGTWQTEIDGCTYYFTFKTVKSSAGENRLKVIQYDPATCDPISEEGVGIEGDRVVNAVIKDKHHHAFELTVHAFNRSDLKTNNTVSFASSKTVYVMNISPLGDREHLTSHELEKLSPDPKGVCK